jgi:RES domain-containing protein
VPKLPEPPAVLPPLKDDDSFEVTPGTPWWRIYFASGPYPIRWDELRWWGPVGARFDHHDTPPRLQDRGVAYFGSSAIVCLAEVFQKTRSIDRQKNDPFLCQFEITSSLQVLDLTADWPTYAGASQAISTGPHARTQRWARAIYDQYGLHGLVYPSAMSGGGRTLAVNERAAIPDPNGGRQRVPGQLLFNWPLADLRLTARLRAAAARLRYGLR